jgi:Cdc6-like AAA superfamily ATPase
MITSPRIFDDDRLPRDILHRDAELQTLSRAWRPVLHGERAADILLSGPSGVGKTVLIRHGLNRVHDATNVSTAHVRCLGLTPGDVLRSILGDLGHDPPGNQPVDELRWGLQDSIDGPLVVVLDEADGLANDDALKHLGQTRNLARVVITHDPERWLSNAPTAIRDRLVGEGSNRLRLDRYGARELVDILERRADRGLRHDSVHREQLETIAAESAGVARDAIQTLRAAAEIAEERGHGRILDDDLEDAYERARRRIREANLRSLPYHHQVLYAIVLEATSIPGGDLHERYDAVAEDAYRDTRWTPIGRRARRNKLSKLKEYDLIEIEGDGSGRRYTVQDEEISSHATINDTNLTIS